MVQHFIGHQVLLLCPSTARSSNKEYSKEYKERKTSKGESAIGMELSQIKNNYFSIVYRNVVECKCLKTPRHYANQQGGLGRSSSTRFRTPNFWTMCAHRRKALKKPQNMLLQSVFSVLLLVTLNIVRPLSEGLI